jgi:hypothetical protein
MTSLIGSMKSLAQLATLRGQHSSDTHGRLFNLMHSFENMAGCGMNKQWLRLVVVGCRMCGTDQKPIGVGQSVDMDFRRERDSPRSPRADLDTRRHAHATGQIPSIIAARSWES